MVLAVVGLASVLGFVMLSSASLQGRAGANQIKSTSADYVAESGLNLAMYYLQHADDHPTLLNAEGYWGGMSTSYTLPNGLPATLDVSVTRDPADQWAYEVVSTAQVGDDSESRIERTTGARLYVRNEYQLKQAAVFNNTVTFNGPFSVNGDVWTTKSLGLRVGAQVPYVSGVGYCRTATTGIGWTSPAGGFRASSTIAAAGPNNNEVNLYKTYEVDEVIYNASVLGSTMLAGVAGQITKGSTASNPAGVWYYSTGGIGSLELGDHVTIEGTLVVEGDLKINGSGIKITPQPGYPAIVVTGSLETVHPGRSVTANGAVYVGTALKQSGTYTTLTQSTMTINGGLILGTTGSVPVPLGYAVKTTVNYNATKARAPELSTACRVAKGVSIVRWGLP